MSTTRYYKYHEQVVVKIQTKLGDEEISQKKIQEIEEALIKSLDDKLKKLNVLLKNVDIYVIRDNLVVNDQYNILKNFEEIVKAFEIDIKKEEIHGLKGKTYIMSDVITDILKVTGIKYDFSKILNIKTLKDTINIDDKYLFKRDNLGQTYDKELIDYLKEIKQSGSIKIEVIETLFDDKIQEINSDRAKVIKKLESYLTNINKQIDENNKNIQKGTAELIYNRARQMGYSVKKEIKNKQVQLVLVRIE